MGVYYIAEREQGQRWLMYGVSKQHNKTTIIWREGNTPPGQLHSRMHYAARCLLFALSKSTKATYFLTECQLMEQNIAKTWLDKTKNLSLFYFWDQKNKQISEWGKCWLMKTIQSKVLRQNHQVKNHSSMYIRGEAFSRERPVHLEEGNREWIWPTVLFQSIRIQKMVNGPVVQRG